MDRTTGRFWLCSLQGDCCWGWVSLIIIIHTFHSPHFPWFLSLSRPPSLFFIHTFLTLESWFHTILRQRWAMDDSRLTLTVCEESTVSQWNNNVVMDFSFLACFNHKINLGGGGGAACNGALLCLWGGQVWGHVPGALEQGDPSQVFVFCNSRLFMFVFGANRFTQGFPNLGMASSLLWRDWGFPQVIGVIVFDWCLWFWLVIGDYDSHSADYRVWQKGGIASKGLEQVLDILCLWAHHLMEIILLFLCMGYYYSWPLLTRWRSGAPQDFWRASWSQAAVTSGRSSKPEDSGTQTFKERPSPSSGRTHKTTWSPLSVCWDLRLTGLLGFHLWSSVLPTAPG